MNTDTSDNLKSVFEKLISFASESRELEASKQCSQYAAEFLESRGMRVANYESNGYPSLVATTKDTKEPKVLLQAHLDVVPAPEELYRLREEGGRYLGRGVYDMKFAGACFMQLADDLKDGLSDYDFGIMFTFDEEVGGEDGVKHLLDQGYGAGVCILPDGGNDWQIEESSNGVWFVRLVASGKSAHGSRPWEGENAINKLVGAINDMCGMFGELNEQRSSVTLSKIQGGEAVNQVPGRAEATLDMRFISMDDYQTKRQAVQDIATKHGIEIEEISQTNPLKHDLNNQFIGEFHKAAEKVRGVPLESCHSLGATDGRFFCERNIPTIIIRPTGGGAHSAEEWLDKAEFEKFYEVIKEYVQTVAKTS